MAATAKLLLFSRPPSPLRPQLHPFHAQSIRKGPPPRRLRQRTATTAVAALVPTESLTDLVASATPVLATSSAVDGSSAGYSLASYYTSLGLFVISVPGLWSLIKRSVRSKIVQKTFEVGGGEKKAPSLVAGEILSFFTRNNFKVADRGETVT